MTQQEPSWYEKVNLLYRWVSLKNRQKNGKERSYTGQVCAVDSHILTIQYPYENTLKRKDFSFKRIKDLTILG